MSPQTEQGPYPGGRPAGQPAGGSALKTTADRERSAALGRFAAVILDGIYLQTIIAAPSFDLETALQDARRALTLLADGEQHSADRGPSA